MFAAIHPSLARMFGDKLTECVDTRRVDASAKQRRVNDGTYREPQQRNIGVSIEERVNHTAAQCRVFAGCALGEGARLFQGGVQ